VAATDLDDLAIRAAWHYYVEDLTQAEVADALRVSRARVVRLLASARASGVVEIGVAGAGGREVALERALVARFGLAEAVVVAAGDPRRTPALVGDAAAAWLGGVVAPGMTVGMGWGETLDHAARSLHAGPQPGVTVISLLGGTTHARAINPTQVARHAADALGAACLLLTAPLVVADEAVREALWREPGLADLRARARRCDVALVSVGEVSPQATLFRDGLLPAAAVAELEAAGAVGDVLCHFIDAAGREVAHAVNRRVMAVDLADLAVVPRLALVSGGMRKVAALRAALAALPVAVLVTDEAAAGGLLAG
jgi:DNA-binding transcriptional regulator LsrR (DeoR family)